MFRLVLVLIGLLPFCSEAHKIVIEVHGLRETEVVVGYHYGTKKYIHDTVKVDQYNRVTISDSDPLKKGVYFIYTPTFYLEFLVVEKEFQIKTSVDSTYRSMEINGSPENELFRDFQIEMSSYQNLLTSLHDSISKQSVDSVILLKEMDRISNEMISKRNLIIQNNNESYFASFLRLLNKNIHKSHGLDSIDIVRFREDYLNIIDNPIQLMRTPTLHEYVVHYFDNIIIQKPEFIIEKIDEWLQKCSGDSSTYRYWLSVFLQKYQEPKIMGLDAVWIHLIEEYCLTGKAFWLPQKTIEELRKEVIFIKPNLIGTTAPSFYAIDTAGFQQNFKELEYEFYVLFFYDPGCSHCRQKAPILNKQTDQIKELGGGIIGICTTTLKNELVSFINEFDLNWYHLWDPKGRSDFRVNYNTRTTPKLYILDKNFKIIGKQLDVSKVTNFLADYSSDSQMR